MALRLPLELSVVYVVSLRNSPNRVVLGLFVSVVWRQLLQIVRISTNIGHLVSFFHGILALITAFKPSKDELWGYLPSWKLDRGRVRPAQSTTIVLSAMMAKAPPSAMMRLCELDGLAIGMQVIGHRGSAETAPENTLLSVKTALTAGTPWIEIDVRHAAGELFVIHDQEVDRTTNGRGSIYDLSRAEILNLDAGKGEVIPTLEQVLDLIAAQASVNIELKDTQSMSPTCKYITDLLRKHSAWRDKIMISTFESSIHDDLAKILPSGCTLGVLFNKLPANIAEYAIRLNAHSINLSFAQLTPALVSQAHRADLKVFVYTVNKVEEIRHCLNIGVDAIYTDNPKKTLALLDASNDR